MLCQCTQASVASSTSSTLRQIAFRGSTAAENNVLVQTVNNPADYGDPPVALELRVGQIRRLDPARL